ncbi:hypothetical protein L4C34_02910 [Vibrio profundum]|uniref:type III secretion system domain-containing protein n=1 Tax=Vibrio profundum TaxID=2910247 RepID=UPI003D113517
MELDLATSRWYQLAYTPGKWMSSSWWEALELSQWRGFYSQSLQCQQALDELICTKRGFPNDNLFRPSTNWQKTLLEDIERLPKLLTALGLIRLARPDYLMLRRFKTALQVYLTIEELEQLLTIFPEEQFIDSRLKVQAEPISEQYLPQLALYLGWSGICQSDLIWQAVAILFPAHFVAEGANDDAFGLLQRWYVRLRRLL